MQNCAVVLHWFCASHGIGSASRGISLVTLANAAFLLPLVLASRRIVTSAYLFCGIVISASTTSADFCFYRYSSAALEDVSATAMFVISIAVLANSTQTSSSSVAQSLLYCILNSAFVKNHKNHLLLIKLSFTQTNFTSTLCGKKQTGSN